MTRDKKKAKALLTFEVTEEDFCENLELYGIEYRRMTKRKRSYHPDRRLASKAVSVVVKPFQFWFHKQEYGGKLYDINIWPKGMP